MKELTLPSGALLKIGRIPFETANNLKKAVMKEIRNVPVLSQRQLADLYKEYICAAFSSEEVEKCLWECMKRCTYNDGSADLKIDKNTFESETARGDFTDIQMEVGIECLTPFGKSLWQLLQRMLAMGESTIPRSK